MQPPSHTVAGTPVEPRSLYLAQLELRLGSIPAWWAAITLTLALTLAPTLTLTLSLTLTLIPNPTLTLTLALTLTPTPTRWAEAEAAYRRFEVLGYFEVPFESNPNPNSYPNPNPNPYPKTLNPNQVPFESPSPPPSPPPPSPPPTPPPAPPAVPDVWCMNAWNAGTQDPGDACCLTECGQCGGSGCSSAPGGAKKWGKDTPFKCCSSKIAP